MTTKLLPETIVDFPTEWPDRYRGFVKYQDRLTRQTIATVLRAEGVLIHDLDVAPLGHKDNCKACQLLRELEAE